MAGHHACQPHQLLQYEGLYLEQPGLGETIELALLYGHDDFLRTLTIACLVSWDADHNATTSAGLLGIMLGDEKLPEPVRTATQIYHNEDVTGGLPEYTSVPEIAARTLQGLPKW